MRILVVSTLKRRIGPDIFASRSRVIYQLARTLVEKGHEVSVLGTKDSVVEGAEIIPILDKGWVDLSPVENEFVRQIASLQELNLKIKEIQGSYDIIHNHTYPEIFPSIIENELQTPLVTTMHAVASDYLDELIVKYPKTYFISLSEGYRRLYSQGKLFDVVYNGVDTSLYKYKEEKEDYLFWLGRLPKGKNKDGSFIDPKGVRNAIELAQKTGSKLFLSAPCEDKSFFDRDIAPFLNDKIQWVGEVSSEQTVPVERIIELMQGAKAFLMTINQEEPFGLVMAEAGSCGTPVIAFDRGSVKEVIKDGITGKIVDPSLGVDGLVVALGQIGDIKPEDCRKHIEANFSLNSLVEGYENLYKKVITDHQNRSVNL